MAKGFDYVVGMAVSVGRSVVDWCGLGLLIDLTTSHGWAFYVVWFDYRHS